MSSLITYQSVRGSPQLLTALSGLDADQFDRLLKIFGPYDERARAESLTRNDRQRATGGGRRENLAMAERLLLALIWIHRHPQHEALASLFGISDSTVSRYLQHLEHPLIALLRKLGGVYASAVMDDPGRKSRDTLTQLFGAIPKLKECLTREGTGPGPGASFHESQIRT